MTRRGFALLALLALLALSGCDASKGSVKVGDELTFTKALAADGKHWVSVDEEALKEFGKPPAEFDKVFDRLVAEKRIFLENDNARVVVLATKTLGAKAAKVRIVEGANPDREVWVYASGLRPIPKP